MNIFATEQGILGATDYARQHNTFQAFLTLARSIRKQLGARAYKLDEYIRQLLIACSIPLEEEFFDREDSATNALAASCRMVAKGGGQKDSQANGCYSIVRAYAQAHPLQNQVDNTRSLIYFCELLDDHLAAAMETMIQDIWSDTAGRMDTVLADALFQEICALLGQEEEMMRLNALFAQRFLSVPLRTSPIRSQPMSWHARCWNGTRRLRARSSACCSPVNERLARLPKSKKPSTPVS